MKKLLISSYFLFFIPYFLFSQNVGIGTTSPSVKLHVVGTTSNVAIFNGANQMYITLAENGSNRGYIGSYSGNAQDIDFGTYSGNDNGKVHLTTANTPRLTVDGDGLVGIGTTLPEQLFSVNGGMVIDQGNFNNGTSSTMLHFGSNSGEGIGSRRTSGNNQYGLDFYTQSFNRMTITNGGNVGIGLTNPSSKLELRGALGFSSTSKRWEMNYDSTAGYFYIDEYGSARRFFIKNGGNVGINTSNPQTTLDVNGDLNIENKLFLNNSTGNAGQVLMSNGGSSSPSWRDAAYSNQDRFLYKTNASNVATGALFNDVIKFDIGYALSSAISYNSSTGDFTVNKSGLYKFSGSFSPVISIQSNENGMGSFYIVINNSIGLLSLGEATIVTRHIASSYTGGAHIPVSMELYLTAGTSFHFFGQISAYYTTINNTGLAYNAISINLVSE